MAESNEKRGTLAVIALIFGIAAISTSWVPFINYLSLLMAIAAMVIGVVELKRIDRGTSSSTGRSFTITGTILGAVAVVLGIVLSFVLSLYVGGVWGYYDLWIF